MKTNRNYHRDTDKARDHYAEYTHRSEQDKYTVNNLFVMGANLPNGKWQVLNKITIWVAIFVSIMIISMIASLFMVLTQTKYVALVMIASSILIAGALWVILDMTEWMMDDPQPHRQLVNRQNLNLEYNLDGIEFAPDYVMFDRPRSVGGTLEYERVNTFDVTQFATVIGYEHLTTKKLSAPLRGYFDPTASAKLYIPLLNAIADVEDAKITWYAYAPSNKPGAFGICALVDRDTSELELYVAGDDRHAPEITVPHTTTFVDEMGDQEFSEQVNIEIDNSLV